jgi:hypothetical protein
MRIADEKWGMFAPNANTVNRMTPVNMATSTYNLTHLTDLVTFLYLMVHSPVVNFIQESPRHPQLATLECVKPTEHHTTRIPTCPPR